VSDGQSDFESEFKRTYHLHCLPSKFRKEGVRTEAPKNGGRTGYYTTEFKMTGALYIKELQESSEEVQQLLLSIFQCLTKLDSSKCSEFEAANTKKDIAAELE